MNSCARLCFLVTLPSSLQMYKGENALPTLQFLLHLHLLYQYITSGLTLLSVAFYKACGDNNHQLLQKSAGIIAHHFLWQITNFRFHICWLGVLLSPDFPSGLFSGESHFRDGKLWPLTDGHESCSCPTEPFTSSSR